MRKTTVSVADSRTDFELAAQLLELWRVCRKSSCRRARSCCGDARACCDMAVDWEEEFRLKPKNVSFAEALRRLRRGERV
jgi:hypothetical protein